MSLSFSGPGPTNLPDMMGFYLPKLTLTPGQMTQADAVFAAGRDEQPLIDAGSICAARGFYNCVVDGDGIDLDGEAALCTGAELLPVAGYAGIAGQFKDVAG